MSSLVLPQKVVNNGEPPAVLLVSRKDCTLSVLSKRLNKTFPVCEARHWGMPWLSHRRAEVSLGHLRGCGWCRPQACFLLPWVASFVSREWHINTTPYSLCHVANEFGEHLSLSVVNPVSLQPFKSLTKEPSKFTTQRHCSLFYRRNLIIKSVPTLEVK